VGISEISLMITRDWPQIVLVVLAPLSPGTAGADTAPLPTLGTLSLRHTSLTQLSGCTPYSVTALAAAGCDVHEHICIRTYVHRSSTTVFIQCMYKHVFMAWELGRDTAYAVKHMDRFPVATLHTAVAQLARACTKSSAGKRRAPREPWRTVRVVKEVRLHVHVSWPGYSCVEACMSCAHLYMYTRTRVLSTTCASLAQHVQLRLLSV